ncbi:hypothetical protein WJX84_009876 [Apatococcus fuscideae]|uniref:Anticodon-binding domain-containing protein n=1 Tax=Apatococcus fuscideae TaxID=2026836 RepID=A0AAW1TDB2_9CHLO
MNSGPAAGMKSKKRGRGAAPSEPMDPTEAARRYQQRKLREEAIKARAQGQGFVPNKKRKFAENPSERPNPTDRHQYADKARPGGRAAFGWGANVPDEDAGSRPMTKVKVIVVPIYWNRKKEEKAQVVAAAGRVEKVLQDAGVSCGIDTTNKLTPGQKFRFWEERHVKIRVELGPKEAAAGQCVVAKCKKPGAVAAKTTVRIGPALVELVQPNVPEDDAAALPAATAVEGDGQPVTCTGCLTCRRSAAVVAAESLATAVVDDSSDRHYELNRRGLDENLLSAEKEVTSSQAAAAAISGCLLHLAAAFWALSSGTDP